MSSNVKAVIFDWDETLSQNRDLVVSSMNYVLKSYSLPDWDTIKKEKRDANKSLKENFPNFFGRDADAAYDLYVTTYRANISHDLKPVAGAPDVVAYLHSKQVPLFVVSNKDKVLLEEEVSCLFSSSPFIRILGNGDAEYNKPHPAPVYEALKVLDLHPNKDEIWLVGDSKQDTDCALASGCVPVLVGSGKFMNADYLAHNDDVKNIINFANFESLLQRLKVGLSFVDKSVESNKSKVTKAKLNP